MSMRKFRRLLLWALIGGAGYWVYRTRPTLPGIVEDLTRPLFHSKAVVKESEYNRVVSEAVPAISHSEEIALGTLHENMKDRDVEDLIGRPEEIQNYRENGVDRSLWIYRRLRRTLVFEERRLVSIAVQ
ncbi:MAG TPA: hypothetical protein VEG84_00910 [Thermoanaerobaculia bacterium]|nr:hypothetical protein [Thermoanaerobaculia bacterium]